MRRYLVPVFGGLFLLTAIGCNNSGMEAPKTPQTMLEVPKQGPVAAGSGGQSKGTNVVPEKKNTTD